MSFFSLCQFLLRHLYLRAEIKEVISFLMFREITGISEHTHKT